MNDRLVSTTFLGRKKKQKKKFPHWEESVDRNPQHITGFSKEKNKLLEIIKKYADENGKILLELNLMETALSSQDDREALFQEFEVDYNKLIDRLAARKQQLIELDNLMKSFRCIEKVQDDEIHAETPTYIKKKPNNDKSFLSIKQTTVKYPQLESYKVVPPPQSLFITNLSQKPQEQTIKRQKLIPSTKVMRKFRASIQPRPQTSIHKPVVIERPDLVEEHQRLVAISLHLERQMLISKMFVRLWHDHRDVSALRASLNSLEGGGESNEEEYILSDLYRIKITNLKNKIAREKARLTYLTTLTSKKERAAVSIQSAMRGYLCRKALNSQKRNNSAVFKS